MNHQAILRAYPNVVTIDDEAGAFDADGNIVEIDVKKVKAAEVTLLNEYKNNEESKTAARQVILDRLGITADEAALLLS
jgi:hypothetical protein